jgi:hypothetical protein
MPYTVPPLPPPIVFFLSFENISYPLASVPAATINAGDSAPSEEETRADSLGEPMEVNPEVDFPEFTEGAESVELTGEERLEERSPLEPQFTVQVKPLPELDHLVQTLSVEEVISQGVVFAVDDAVDDLDVVESPANNGVESAAAPVTSDRRRTNRSRSRHSPAIAQGAAVGEPNNHPADSPLPADDGTGEQSEQQDASEASENEADQTDATDLQPTPIPASGEQIELNIPTLPPVEGTPPTSPPTDEPPPAEPLPTDPSEAPAIPASPPEPGTLDPTQIIPPAATEGPDVIDLSADYQEYDTIRRIFFAEGNVVMRFRGAVLASDRLRVNIPNRTAVAEGNVVLTRGSQVLRGDRFNYNFTQEQGIVLNARGEVFLTSASADLSPSLPTDVSAGASINTPLSQILLTEQPVTGVTSPGGLVFRVGGGGRTPSSEGAAATEGTVSRLRYEADEIQFVGDNVVATNVRLTNDPFSPPELEIRSPQVTFTRLSPTRSEIRARNPRVVIDQGFSLPLFRDRIILDQRRRDPGLLSFGFDEEDRDGFYIERSFDVFSSPVFRFSVTPQILVQRALENDGDFGSASSYGLVSQIDLDPDLLTTVRINASFSSLDFGETDEQLRASIRVQRQVLTGWGPHRLALEYSFRDRLFNGSLGFQTVRRSLGAVFSSPAILLGDSGISLSYQVGAQYINASTDRLDLRDPTGLSDRVDLGRFQAAVALSRAFLLWFKPPLPATPDEGLRYSPNPIVPYVSLITGLRGVTSFYSSGDEQLSLTGTIGLQGQFGYFSRPFFDYTGFNVFLSPRLRSGESPFLFDRDDDQLTLSAGIIQQIAGPVRLGFQAAVDLSDGDEIDREIILEYVRRTFSITLRFSPVRETGSLTFRINDFNWSGTGDPFSGTDASTVDGGVQRSTD